MRNNTFFWIFDPRFDYLCTLFAEHLLEETGRLHTPIKVRSFFVKSDEKDQTLQLGRSTPENIFQEEPENMNRLFLQHLETAHSPNCRPRKMAVASFTNSNLAKIADFLGFGPLPQLSKKWNCKSHQHVILAKAGLPLPDHEIFPNIQAFQRGCENFLQNNGPSLVRPTEAAGGYLVQRIESVTAADAYTASLSEPYCRKPLILSREISLERSPSVWGVVGPKKMIRLFGVSDQLLNGFRFDGNVFPGFAPPKLQADVLSISQQVGGFLAADGYRGFFCVDFLYGLDQRLYVSEVNARITMGVLYLARALGKDLFSVLRGDIIPPLLPPPATRQIVFKIRPEPKQIYPILPPDEGKLVDFFSGNRTSAKEFFCKAPVKLTYGSYLGAYARKFNLDVTEPEVLDVYQQERMILPCPKHRKTP